MQTVVQPSSDGLLSGPQAFLNQLSPQKRVLLADDDALVRAAVNILFSHHKTFEVVGEAVNGDEAIAMASQVKPDLLLLDVNMPKKGGLEALRDLGQCLPEMRTILLTVSIDAPQILKALQLGARGIVLKETARHVLIDAVNAVLDGKFWVDRSPVNDVDQVISDLQPVTQQKIKHGLLTPREVQVVGLVVEGCTNKDIARALSTSEQVIKNYLGKIFDKLGVFNRLELARWTTTLSGGPQRNKTLSKAI
jgi:two-component system, NarL family, nitrate/nitrite response regulator NarL